MAEPRKRGRPRSFDKEEKLRQIMKTFWSTGFAATSLDDLSDATGLTRPSLYTAYGDKTDMYLLALEMFVGQMRAQTVPALFGEGDLEAALTGFYSGALDIYFGSRKKALGCPVFTTAIADAGSDKRIGEAVAGFVSGLDEALTGCLAQRAPHLGEEGARALAQQAAGLLMNLATRARAGAKRAELDEIAARSAALIAGAAERPRTV